MHGGLSQEWHTTQEFNIGPFLIIQESRDAVMVLPFNLKFP
jgi:hypothetical protein